ncbi:MAG: preprotein translocase subunit YajC [Fluviicola sp.]|nr:preprotein translocase subunit YajC [Fluviicola sp.]MBP6271698.1 preprotein translocase subunit YajC [Fluviicola sp.]
MQIIMLGLMVVVFYFFLIRPQQKKQKELREFRKNIQTGDKVITIGGVHGKVLEITDTTILISSEGTKIRFEKSAISQQVAETLEA